MTADDLPDFKPYLLRGLTYAQAVEQMKITGCARFPGALANRAGLPLSLSRI